MNKIELTDIEKDFANHVGYEVRFANNQTGINMGLYFPETWIEDGILKANGVNVFFPKENRIIIQQFDQVQLIFPTGITRLNAGEAIYAFGAWLTTRNKAITVGAAHSTPAFLELMQHFSIMNNLPQCRENWTDYVYPSPDVVEKPVDTDEVIKLKKRIQELESSLDDIVERHTS